MHTYLDKFQHRARGAVHYTSEKRCLPLGFTGSVYILFISYERQSHNTRAQIRLIHGLARGVAVVDYGRSLALRGVVVVYFEFGRSHSSWRVVATVDFSRSLSLVVLLQSISVGLDLPPRGVPCGIDRCGCGLPDLSLSERY